MEKIVNHWPTFFIGRDSFFQELHEMLQSKRQVVISAPAGMGKTAVAREYARRFSHVYEWIFCMSIASTEIWLADSLELAARLALPIATDEQNLIGVNQILQNWFTQHQNYLLIIDNVGSITLPVISEQATGHTLFLTRKSVTDLSIAQIHLARLEAEEGALWLLRQSGQLPADAALEQADEEVCSLACTLADEMAGLPLALHLACANMRVSGRSVHEFLTLYRQYVERLVQLKVSKDSTTDALAITCSLPAIRLQRTHRLATELLWLCVVLAPIAIPREIFLQGASELTPALRELAQNPALLDEALAELSSLGLLVTDEASEALSMQMTAQETLRQAQPEEKRNSLITYALRAFFHLLPALEQATSAARMRVAAQILHLATLSSNWVIPHEAVADVFGWAASLLWEHGLIQDAELLLRKALMVWERVLGTGHETVSMATYNLGTLNALLENYTEAETLLQSALLARSRALGATHPEVILCLLDLASVYAEQDKSKETRACYLEALKIGEPALGQEHPLLVMAAHRLAELCAEEEEFAEAEEYYRRVLPIYEATLGMEDSRTQECLQQMVDSLLEQEKYAEAEELLQRLLLVYEATLGMEDSRTQECLAQMVNAYLGQEKIVQAEDLLLRLLAVRERTLGIEDPDTRTLMHKIAQLSMILGDLVRTKDIYQRLAVFCEHALGQEHAETRRYLGQLLLLTEARQTLEQLASLYLQQGELADTESAFPRISQEPD